MIIFIDHSWVGVEVWKLEVNKKAFACGECHTLFESLEKYIEHKAMSGHRYYRVEQRR
jgi:hypothetical protein